MNSCLMLAPQVQDREVTTIEGFAHNKKLDVIQQKFIDCGAVQCGYCTPGLIVAAKALLDREPAPDARGVPRRDGRQYLPVHGLQQDPARV